MQVITIILGCLPIKDRTLLLKTPQSSGTGLVGLELVLTQGAPSCGLDFIVLEGPNANWTICAEV